MMLMLVSILKSKEIINGILHLTTFQLYASANQSSCSLLMFWSVHRLNSWTQSIEKTVELQIARQFVDCIY